MQVSTPSPLGTPDTPTTLYRLWNEHLFIDELTRIPELSSNGGISYTQSSLTNNGGIALADNSPFAPVLALNPTKQFNAGENKYFDELLYGDDRVYLSRSNGNAWDPISGVLSPFNFISALAIAPSGNGVYYAGTTDGKFFAHPSGGTFVDRTAGLPGGIRINGITVDPKKPNVVYVMLDNRTGGSSVYKSSDSGPDLVRSAPRCQKCLPTRWPSTHGPAPERRTGWYVGTENGAYVTVDGGATWLRLGQALPGVPVVGLLFNEAQETLVAATQGRGVFTLSTDHSGPAVDSVIPPRRNDSGAWAP